MDIKKINFNHAKEIWGEELNKSLCYPVNTASSVALGTFVGFLPFYGYQTILVLLLTHILKLNKVLAMISSFVNFGPVLLFTIFGSLKVGFLLTGSESSLNFNHFDPGIISSCLLSYILGGIIFALLLCCLSFAATWVFISIKNSN